MAGVERFSRMAKQYDGNKSPTLDPTVDAVRRLHWWPTEPSLRAMELGCGTGQLSFALLDSLSSVTGVDPAQGMIDVLSEKIEESELGERMSAVCANLLEGQPEGLRIIARLARTCVPKMCFRKRGQWRPTSPSPLAQSGLPCLTAFCSPGHPPPRCAPHLPPCAAGPPLFSLLP